MDEQRVIATIKGAMPAVVSIMIAKHLEDLERELPLELFPFVPGHPKGPKVKVKFKIPEALVDDHGMVEIGGGSGFAVGSDGIILTNKHVISDPNAEYTVITNDGNRSPASVLSRDPINDVAILKIAPPSGGLPVITLGDAHHLELGQGVIAIGNALGIFKNTVSLGIVSGLSRAISAKPDLKTPPQEMRGLIQTDAAINPGNSGGPLVNLDGKAVGINAAVVFGAQNIGFAIPINAARRDLDDLRKYGRIRRPFLGLRYIVIDGRLKEKMKLPVDYGALVVNESAHDHGVVPGGPAERAGLLEKDIVLECNAKKVTTEHPIQDYLDNLEVGDAVELLVLRNGDQFKTTVTLTERR